MEQRTNKNKIVNIIKQKKELSGITDSVVLEGLEEYLKKHKIELTKLREKEIKLIVKDIRKQLRKYSGMFQKSQKDRLEMLENDKINNLLKTHVSTAERMDFYPKLKEIIKTLDVKSILDLGSGLNPIALAERGIKYYAIDINEENIGLVKEFFKKINISGETFVCDLRKISSLQKTDICIIFKVLDIIEEKGHNIAKKIIDKINSKYILISFAKKTLSGKNMRYPRRNWLERLLEKKKWNYKILNSNNEIFYLIEKKEG